MTRFTAKSHVVHGLFNAGPAGNPRAVRDVVPGMSQPDLASSTAPSGPARPRVDLRSVALSAGSTLAWYAVPDLVRSRGSRALAKTAVLASAVTLAMTTTREGAEARSAVRDVRAAVDAVRPGDPRPGPDDGDGAVSTGGTGRAVATGAVVVGGLTVAGVVAVLGERWAYRAGEHLRARGVRAPHTTVGLVLGAAAGGLAAIEGPVTAERSR